MIPRDFAVPIVPVESCPIQASLGVLGRKWALLVLRDIAFYEKVRFTDILRKNAGLTPRILTFRLKELATEGVIQRMLGNSGKRDVFYELTAKGADAIPILAAYLNDDRQRNRRGGRIVLPERYEFLQRMDFFKAIGLQKSERFARHEPTGRFVLDHDGHSRAPRGSDVPARFLAQAEGNSAESQRLVLIASPREFGRPAREGSFRYPATGRQMAGETSEAVTRTPPDCLGDT